MVFSKRISILKEAEAGIPIKELYRKYANVCRTKFTFSAPARNNKKSYPADGSS